MSPIPPIIRFTRGKQAERNVTNDLHVSIAAEITLSWSLFRRLPALVLNQFDIQSRRGYHYESHGFSCRSPALVLNFSPEFGKTFPLKNVSQE